jgi:glycosyltransferase involved in cell wall biosynthesis
MDKIVKNMRILLIADMNFFGGTRTYFEMLVDLLLRQGYTVEALLSFPDGDREFYTFAEQRQTMRWKRLPSATGIFRLPPWRQLCEVVLLSFALLRYRPKFVIVSTGTPVQWLTTFLFPLPSLQILHTVIQTPARRFRLGLSLLLSRLSKKRRITTVSRHAAEQAALHWGCNIAYIHNPTPFPEAVNSAKTVPHPGAVGRVITVGHVVDYKNPYLWMDVARRVLAIRPDASFTWYGDGPLLEEMRRLTQGEQRIQFTGRAHDMPPVYTHANVYFQPSLLENHSLAVLEAMSHGLPCVVSDRGGMPESVVHGKTGYVENVDDAVSFVERIVSLLDDENMVITFGKNAQQRIRECFMPKLWEARMLALINEITAS